VSVECGTDPNGPSNAWAKALRIARRPREAGRWCNELANAMADAVRPDAAGVFLCRLGDIADVSLSVAPREHSGVGERLARDWLPRLRRAGLDSSWNSFAEPADAREASIARSIRLELLEPAGFRGMLGVFLRAHDGRVAGFLSVFTRTTAAERRAVLSAQLAGVRGAAEASVRASMDVAAALGARFPELSTDPLTPRERQVATLAANGFSDLAIAQRLSIAEGTVGRHLHNIYRKLGVSSRIALVNALCLKG
jgi:DNA-binding CsgD family transcriptional regulator